MRWRYRSRPPRSQPRHFLKGSYLPTQMAHALDNRQLILSTLVCRLCLMTQRLPLVAQSGLSCGVTAVQIETLPV